MASNMLKGWNVQDLITKGIFMISVFLLSASARGEWLLFMVYIGKDYFGDSLYPLDNARNASTLPAVPTFDGLGLRDLPYYIVAAVLVSFSIFWGIGFTFDIYYYKNRRNTPKDWKCQPDRFLTLTNEWHEFGLGSFNMLVGSVASGIISCYIMNGGNHCLYLTISDYGWMYFLGSIPAFYLYVEAVSYYPHRFFHNPFLYKTVHKIHHRYGSPTLYSTTAMHPLEFLMYQTFLAVPVFTVPLHVGVYLTILLYGYYYGMMDHSGIKMDAMWPWQPNTLFHDNHHRYFHCNFGFNSLLFDRFHGTLRKKNYKYGEKVFGGRGKATEQNARAEYYSY